VLVGVLVAAGVRVLVNSGRTVLVGVGVTRDALSLPKLQPASTSASSIAKVDRNRVRFLIAG
jgi:hypothetical protein